MSCPYRPRSQLERGKRHREREMRKQDAYKVMFSAYPDVVNIEQLCEMLGGISTKTGYRLLKTVAIKSYMIGHRYRIPKIRDYP